MDGLKEIIFAQQNIYRAAFSNHPDARKLQAILRIWDSVKDDPAMVIPTKLALIIEAARA